MRHLVICRVRFSEPLGKYFLDLPRSNKNNLFSNLPPRPPRCRAHHGHPGRERRVQLPGGLPRRHPGAVRVAVGEEGRRNGTTVHTPLLQYNAAHLPCVCFCLVEDGSSPRRARRCKVYCALSQRHGPCCPVLVVTGAAGPALRPTALVPRAPFARLLCIFCLLKLRTASCTTAFVITQGSTDTTATKPYKASPREQQTPVTDDHSYTNTATLHLPIRFFSRLIIFFIKRTLVNLR